MPQPSSAPPVSRTRIGVIACDALKDEVESLLQGQEGIVHKEYVEFGRHLHPDDLRPDLIEKVNALEGKVDAVFLAYAHCQSLKGIPNEVRVPTVMLECEDCIAAFLGPEEYSRQKHTGQITWFYPSGWARYGVDGIIRLFRLDSARDQGYEPDYFLGQIFNGFKRCLFIDTGAGDIAQCESNSCAFAARLGLTHQRTQGSLIQLRNAFAEVRALAIEAEMEACRRASGAESCAEDLDGMIGGG